MRFILLLILLSTPVWAEFSPTPFLKKYGWELEGKAKQQTIDIPAELNGPAFTNYQSRCQAVGLNLEPFRGRKGLPFYVCTLKQRTGKANTYKIFAYLVVDQEKVVGAWLGTDAPVAPGLSSLDDKNFGKNWRARE